jgi:hypothetical protein
MLTYLFDVLAGMFDAARACISQSACACSDGTMLALLDDQGTCLIGNVPAALLRASVNQTVTLERSRCRCHFAVEAGAEMEYFELVRLEFHGESPPSVGWLVRLLPGVAGALRSDRLDFAVAGAPTR